MANILIIGCGSLGSQLAVQLIALGHQVTGLKRNPPKTAHDGINYVCADIAKANTLKDLATDFDVVYFIVSPDGRGNEDSYRAVYENGLVNLLAKFSATNASPQWIFVSSTSVYAQSQGEWVDEDSVAEPDNTCGQLIRQAEQRLVALNAQNIVVRFSGIYGSGREYLLRMAQSTPAIQQSPPYYTNRIHQEDCVGVLAFLLACRLKGVTMQSYYLASDDNPATMWDVLSWLAEQLHCATPTVKPFSADAVQNKRCSNQRLRALGYQFNYPSFKEGYLELIRTKSDGNCYSVYCY